MLRRACLRISTLPISSTTTATSSSYLRTSNLSSSKLFHIQTRNLSDDTTSNNTSFSSYNVFGTSNITKIRSPPMSSKTAVSEQSVFGVNYNTNQMKDVSVAGNVTISNIHHQQGQQLMEVRDIKIGRQFLLDIKNTHAALIFRRFFSNCSSFPRPFSSSSANTPGKYQFRGKVGIRKGVSKLTEIDLEITGLLEKASKKVVIDKDLLRYFKNQILNKFDGTKKESAWKLQMLRLLKETDEPLKLFGSFKVNQPLLDLKNDLLSIEGMLSIDGAALGAMNFDQIDLLFRNLKLYNAANLPEEKFKKTQRKLFEKYLRDFRKLHRFIFDYQIVDLKTKMIQAGYTKNFDDLTVFECFRFAQQFETAPNRVYHLEMIKGSLKISKILELYRVEEICAIHRHFLNEASEHLYKLKAVDSSIPLKEEAVIKKNFIEKHAVDLADTLKYCTEKVVEKIAILRQSGMRTNWDHRFELNDDFETSMMIFVHANAWRGREDDDFRTVDEKIEAVIRYITKPETGKTYFYALSQCGTTIVRRHEINKR